MNFKFLEKYEEFKTLYSYCTDAETFVYSKPSLCGMLCRNALEYTIKLFYKIALPNVELSDTFYDMISKSEFVNLIEDEDFISCLHFVRKLGNLAAHAEKFEVQQALDMFEYTHYAVGYIFQMLNLVKDLPEYYKPEYEKQNKGNRNIIVNKEAELDVSEDVLAKYATKFGEIEYQNKSSADEKVNKKLFFRATLAESNWKIALVTNQAIPSTCCLDMILDNGEKVDYVLFGANNKPLAIVEYALSNAELLEARKRAISHADLLEKKYGERPIIYYSSGYHTYIIEPDFYDKPRRVFGIHTIQELELIKSRFGKRKDISNPIINDTITNRDYQKRAITSTCKAFMSKRRKSLLVMATGTGKTRVSISLVDVLTKANWVKNVLFLADRTSLVNQAFKNYKKLLPSMTQSVYTGSSQDRDPEARIIFSTYQTMINLVDGPNKEFGLGRFDLIIIDEAHRSIFKKYKTLFSYFDALMVGLTATPRCEENKSTYEMFELPFDTPDFAYELEEAIDDKFLVGFNVQDRTTKLLQRGITYDDLSQQEKDENEDFFDELEVSVGGSIKSDALTKNVINTGTIDAMLNDLMQNGIKIEGGDKIGKTIIFAPSHEYAVAIVERFYKTFSGYSFDFCKLIDSQITNNQQIIDSFEVRGKDPTIAVSVDMMDTGIDVPDVLNLVFFKQVKSKIKFLQMIGRGTRLSPDIFGPNLDKKGFLIFDYFDNFRYFNTNNTWKGLTYTNSMPNLDPTYRINSLKLAILGELCGSGVLNTFNVNYLNELKTYFYDSILNLNNDSLLVINNMALVNKFRKKDLWDNNKNIINSIDLLDEKILPLFEPNKSTTKEKIFDIIIYTLEAKSFEYERTNKSFKKMKSGFRNLASRLTEIMEELLKLNTIPEIVSKNTLIKSLIDGEYLFKDFSLEKAEYVRNEIRSLLNYIAVPAKYYVVSFEDSLIGGSSEVIPQEKTYYQKITEYLNDNSNVILSKIRNLDVLTEEEKNEITFEFNNKLGTNADCVAWCNGVPLLAKIRSYIGIEEEAIQVKFGSFLNENVLNELQLQFANQIIEYARVNGDIIFKTLLNESPFSEISIIDLFNEKIGYVKELVNVLHRSVV